MNNYTTEVYDIENVTPARRDNISEFSEKEEADNNNDTGMGEPDNIIYVAPSFFLSNTNSHTMHVSELPDNYGIILNKSLSYNMTYFNCYYYLKKKKNFRLVLYNI